MAMTTGDAHHVNTLLRWLTRQPQAGNRVPTADAARDAAAVLADRAHKILSAGITGSQVQNCWSTTGRCAQMRQLRAIAATTSGKSELR